MGKRLIVFVFLALLYKCRPTESLKTEADLAKHLLDEYRVRFRPVKDPREVVHVNISVALSSLMSVSDAKEKIKVLLSVAQNWNDSFLQWDPTEWSNITSLVLPSGSIWLPDGQFQNSLKLESPLKPSVIVVHNGFVSTDDFKYMDVRCAFDISDFPFDVQVCDIDFGPWLSSVDHIYYSQDQYDKEGHNYNRNPEWQVLSFTPSSSNMTLRPKGGLNVTVQFLSYELRMRRKPAFYLYVLILPTFLITTVTIIGLFTPTMAQGERAEKVTLGLTNLLAMAVILDVVTGQMPKSSTGLPRLGWFVVTEMLLTTLATTFATLILIIHERVLYRDKNPPRWLCRLTFVQLRKYKVSSEETSRKDSLKLITQQLPYADLQKVLHYLRAIHDELQDESKAILWQRIFSALDLLIMLSFLVINIVLTVIILVV